MGKAQRPLSPREDEVLRALTEGRTEKEVAQEMGLSPHTIHVHVKSIYKKFAVNRRAELLRKVFRRRSSGWPPSPWAVSDRSRSDLE